jgi:hypothetical protein
VAGSGTSCTFWPVVTYVNAERPMSAWTRVVGCRSSANTDTSHDGAPGGAYGGRQGVVTLVKPYCAPPATASARMLA